MINHHFNNKTILLISSFFLLFSSCKKFLSIPPSQTETQTKQIFENDDAAVSATTGLYNQMLTSNLWLANGGVTVYSGLSADELVNTNSAMAVDGFTANTLMPDNEILAANFWIPAYKTIYHANAILEGLQNTSALTPAVHSQLQGEALLVRALHYFYLVNLFGDVPLLITSGYEINSRSSRKAASVIYEQIIADLETAKTLLNVNYPSAGRTRPNQFTVEALLARVYLYKGDWSKATIAATAIIDAGLYELVTDIDQAFVMDSPEAIWQLVTDNYNTAEAAAFIPALSFFKPAYVATDHLLNAFEPGDIRKEKWLKLSTAGGQNNYYPFKYKMRSAAPTTEYYMVFRLAEQFLIRAEARAQQDDLAGAIADLNTIRHRAGLGDTPAADKSTLLEAIQNERRIELLAEWGHRWFDLKRTGVVSTVLQPLKAGWQATDTLYPIPLAEINSNPLLYQNPGY
ncbi:RagB/SusD family nutrient uptake outer membrane protein [Terrimonas pollutisoli]|uniref:RagB/SusD family nutrient uptake outer membrane protein n=1 Tax=Terrimonas pollutisoli TaxID=3034147 RepID=UPI0023ED1E99|nr:RagB/SusD family nutrient uptake outer membrane protein [Terrimonas sp. H1YJ31]